jgi:phosphate-selective porin OprO/OprP
LVLAGLSFAQPKQAPQKSVSEQILDILLERKIVSQQKYQELKAQVEAERKQRQQAAASGYQIKYQPAKGLALSSKDGANSVALTGRLQVDGKAFTQDSGDHASFYVRRARLAARVKWHHYYHAFVEAEFGGGKAGLNDAYLDIAWWPQLRFKFGQYKQPFSLEELQSDNWIWLTERALINSLAPSRDIGMMAYGELGRGDLYWYLSLSNGQGKNVASDQNSGKDLAARVVGAPLRFTKRPLFKDLYLGGAVTWGNQNSLASDWWRDGKLVTPARHTWFQVDGGVRQNGVRLRYGAELFWSVGPVAFMGELVRVQFDGLQLGALNKDLAIWGGYGQVSWMLTGEHVGYKGGKPSAVRPRRAFGWGPGAGWGAWQLAARYDYCSADPGWRDYGFVDATRYSSAGRGLTLGVNWYINDMVRAMLDFFDYEFDQQILVNDVPQDSEQGFLARVQVVF